MASVFERITSALSSLGKRRNRESGADEDAGGLSASSSRTVKRFRPWDQADVHRRLETYKPLTWFAKPDSVGPITCALRGWVNQACDKLSCEYCNAILVYPPRVPFDQRQAAADLFLPCLTTKHAANCPWRQTSCSPSLLAYMPNSSNDDLCQLFNSLQDKLLKVDVLPNLDAIAIQTVRDAATPFGSYEDIVLGVGNGAAAAAAFTPRRTPIVRILDVDDDGASAAQAAAACPSTPSAAAAAAAAGPATPIPDPAASTTIIVQPSKLTPQQKARLLALLGWDLDVLQPDTAGGSAAAPYTQSSGYSLQHLGVKPRVKPANAKGASGAAAVSAATGGCSDAANRYPMSSVVLKCNHCNGRMGLWNFAGVRPVPSGRLTPTPAARSAVARLGARPGAGGSTATATPAATTSAAAAAADPLSVTIAGGQYALHGFGGGASSRPFGAGAASSTPFRFGACGESNQPVFGIAALDAEAQRLSQAQSTTSVGGGGDVATMGSSHPFATYAGKTLPASLLPASTPPSALRGHKRKADEPGGAGGPEPMSLDAGESAMGEGLMDAKRPRMASASLGVGAGAPSTPLPSAPLSAELQPRDLDPVGQHRTWCPWVYTGTGEERHKSGWQHMLSALSAQQQQLLAPAGAAVPTADSAATANQQSPNAKQRRDQAVAAIRAL